MYNQKVPSFKFRKSILDSDEDEVHQILQQSTTHSSLDSSPFTSSDCSHGGIDIEESQDGLSSLGHSKSFENIQDSESDNFFTSDGSSESQWNSSCATFTTPTTLQPQDESTIPTIESELQTQVDPKLEKLKTKREKRLHQIFEESQSFQAFQDGQRKNYKDAIWKKVLRDFRQELKMEFGKQTGKLRRNIDSSNLRELLSTFSANKISTIEVFLSTSGQKYGRKILSREKSDQNLNLLTKLILKNTKHYTQLKVQDDLRYVDALFGSKNNEENKLRFFASDFAKALFQVYAQEHLLNLMVFSKEKKNFTLQEIVILHDQMHKLYSLGNCWPSELDFIKEIDYVAKTKGRPSKKRSSSSSDDDDSSDLSYDSSGSTNTQKSKDTTVLKKRIQKQTRKGAK